MSYDQISISSEFNSLSDDAVAVPNNNSNTTSNNSSQNVSPLHTNNKCITLPSKLNVKNIDWDEFDDLLQVERKINESEKLYQTMPSPLPSSQSLTSSSEPVESENVELSETSSSSKYYSINTPADDDNYETPNGTLKSGDFEEFKKQSNYEYVNGTNAMKSVEDGTLKFNQPIDMSRINDSLKLYNDNIMSKSYSNDYYVSSSSASRNYNLQKSESTATNSTITGDKKSSSTDDDTWTPDRGLIRSKSGPNFSGQSYIDSDDSDTNTNTLKPSDRAPRSVSIRMNCYNDEELNGIGNDDDNMVSSTSSTSATTTSDADYPPNHYVNEDGVVMRKPPPKTGSTAIKRRSGNRRYIRSISFPFKILHYIPIVDLARN